VIPPAFLQDLTARVDIVDLVGRQVQLKRGGANWMGLCPFHAEKSPSFTVSPSKQFYHCFGCGAHGDAIRFLVEHNGMSFIDAVKDLAQQVGMTVPDDDRTPQQREQAEAQKQRRATLSDVLARYARFFDLFTNFRSYVEFFLLQDLVSDNFSSVRIADPFHGFNGSPIPTSVHEYNAYKIASIAFISARNRRILADG